MSAYDAVKLCWGKYFDINIISNNFNLVNKFLLQCF
jgi:hypothetical protein